MYDGKYSITFESIDTGQKRNTWADWHLVPAEPPMVSPPEAYTNYVDIPGRKDGPLDLSEVLSDGPVFLNAEGSWEFLWNSEHCKDMTRVQAFKTVTQFLHGRRFRITFEEDPDTSYIGRLQVSDFKPGNVTSSITIDYIIQPTNANPLDVDGSNYVSNSGEIPWYSGPINQSSGSSGSGSGSGSGNGSDGSSASTTNKYINGWNDARAAAQSMYVYSGTLRTEKYGPQTVYYLEHAIKMLRYFKPAAKSGTSDYDKGWNDMIAAMKSGTYYIGGNEIDGTSGRYYFGSSGPGTITAYTVPAVK